jgi:hypothetical protein
MTTNNMLSHPINNEILVEIKMTIIGEPIRIFSIPCVGQLTENKNLALTEKIVAVLQNEYNDCYSDNKAKDVRIEDLTNQAFMLRQTIEKNSSELQILRDMKDVDLKKIGELEKQNKLLMDEIIALKEVIATKDEMINNKNQEITQMKDDINVLKNDNNILKNDNSALKDDINILKNDKQKFDALVRLSECNALVNKHFKSEYRKTFKPHRSERIPEIGEIIANPPDQSDPEYLKFWKDFNINHPRSDDPLFRNIYMRISNARAHAGAHVNIADLKPNEFDKSMSIALPELYNADKKLCGEYRDWLFGFPA